MCASGAVLKVNWMDAIEVCACRHAIRVPGPHCTGSVLGRQAEGIRVLPQTVNVGIERKRRFNTKVLRLEDDRESSSVEEYLVARLADDCEGEWRFGVLELDFRVIRGAVARRTWEDRFGNLVTDAVRIGDCDVNPRIYRRRRSELIKVLTTTNPKTTNRFHRSP